MNVKTTPCTQGHVTFEPENGRENFQFLERHCVFPHKLLQTLGGLVDNEGGVVALVKQYMGKELVDF